jgi:16S rRNA (cytosine967-C5)-methyltransferase
MIAPARVAAYEILRAIEDTRLDLGSALARYRARLKDDERDRALAGEIATGTLRWQGAYDHVIEQFSKRPLRKLDPEVVIVLRLSMFQLLELDRIPASAAVKDAVDLAGKAGKRSAAGLVNALLRRVSRERESLPLPKRPEKAGDRDAALAYLAVTLSHPRWLVERWLDRYGFEAAERWARFNNAPAPLTLRVNTLKGSRDNVAAELAAHGIPTSPTSRAPDGLVIQSGNPLRTPVADGGLYFVQDEASQLVGEFAAARPGEYVLDACASPGGKTVTMSAAMSGRGVLVAGDVRDRRVALLRQTVQRAGAANVRIVQADASVALPFGEVFDRVLLDAPCSGLGTLRRDPDIKWRRQEADLPALADAQLRMLEQAAAAVKPGGVVIYATCSSEPDENDDVVRRFLERHPQFAPEGARFRTDPPHDGLEAFFAAMLVRAKDLR